VAVASGWRFAWVICGKVAIFQGTSGAMSSSYANKLGCGGEPPAAATWLKGG